MTHTIRTHTIAHLSDLHFGRIDAATLDPLVAAIKEAQPDLVAVSGDLTQRARRHEFAEARAFLDRLPSAHIVVPGNHDVPLHNPWARFVSKWARFRRYIQKDLEQVWTNDAIAAIGINTARALAWKGGRISAAQMARVHRCFMAAAPGALKVLVVHHPLDVPHEWAGGHQAMRARKAFEHWAECGVDLILAGHVHRAFAGGAAERLRIGNHDAVVAQAGTATSTRGRGEPNSFNLIRVSAGEVRVIRLTWRSAVKRFEVSHEDAFARPG